MLKSNKKKENNCIVEFNGKNTYRIVFSNKTEMIKRKGTNGLYIYVKKDEKYSLLS